MDGISEVVIITLLLKYCCFGMMLWLLVAKVNTASCCNCVSILNVFSFPILKYIEFNKVYNLTHFIRSFTELSPFDESKGSDIIYEESNFNPQIKYSAYTSEIDIENLNYLKKILMICQKNNIKPVLYTAPIYNFEEYYGARYPDFRNYIENLSNNLGLSYLDYVNIFSQQKKLYKDIKHLNYKGTHELTKRLIKNGTFKTNTY